MPGCGLQISGYDSDEVICSQGLSECVMKDVMPIPAEKDDAVEVQNLKPYVKLCCSNSTKLCTLCLVIDTELYISPDKDMQDTDHSGFDDETRNAEAFLKMCYRAEPNLPICKKVEFTINHTAISQQNKAKMSMVIVNPDGIFFSSQVFVYPSKSKLFQEVRAPSQNEVCHQELQGRVKMCPGSGPELSFVYQKEMNCVELQFAYRNKSLPYVCIQYEQNGTCQNWSSSTVPLFSVTPCMCLQVWDEDDDRSIRFQHCPFTNKDVFQKNVWQNMTVSVRQGQMKNNGGMLLWNLSAPCRLEGEVWPCHKEFSCTEIEGLRQQLATGKWNQNSKGLWEKRGVFEDISLKPSSCVMVKVIGMGHELGPFCFKKTDRWRWNLLIVGVMLLVCLTALMFYLLRASVKKWVLRWHYDEEIVKEVCVVLLSPPDVDDDVSKSVDQLNSLLCNRGFSVSVDQWSRNEQCTLGPLLWLHAQLLEPNTRVVLVVTHKSLERTEEWAHQHKEVVTEDKSLPEKWSPYADVFTAALNIIQGHKQLGGAGERFILVKFDTHLHSHRNLPKLLQGLPLFKLPSQTEALLAELRSRGRTWIGWKRNVSDRWQAKTEKGPEQQKIY